MKVVIVGSSAAAISCAETLRKNDKSVEITIIGKETYMPYYRPSLSHMLCNEDVESRFYLKSEEYYSENNIELVLGKTVESVDRENKKVILDNKEQYFYDKLLLGVGSNNFMPPVEGGELEGVCNLKFFEDLKTINNYMENKCNIVIIGGGLLGIEAAWAFRKANKNVTILEFSDRLMARQLNEKASSMVKKELEKEGINVFTGKSTKCIIGNGKVEKILLESGEKIYTDIVMFSVGVRPEVSLANSCGLKVGRGILVDENMKTSDENIYAAGDCVEVNGMCLGIWPMAMQTGKIAAMDMLGKKEKLVMNPPTTILKALNIGVYSAGDVFAKDDEIEINDSEGYKLFTFKENVITGINLIGETKLSSKGFSMLSKKMTKDEVLEIIK